MLPRARFATFCFAVLLLCTSARSVRAPQGIPWKSAEIGIELTWEAGPRVTLDGFVAECGDQPNTYLYATSWPPDTTAVLVHDLVPTQGEYYCQMTVFFGDEALVSNELHFTCDKRRCYAL